MKAVLALTAVTAAVAGTVNCRIPDAYVTGGTTDCTGVKDGYKIWGTCATGLSTDVFTTQTNNDRVAFTASAFKNTAVGGCVIPAPNLPWTITTGMFVADLSTNANACGQMADSTATPPVPAIFDAAASVIKGAEVRCDTAANYWPYQGVEGVANCGPGAGVGPWPATTATDDYWFTGAVLTTLDSTSTTATTLQSGEIEFAGTDMLMCAKACTLPASVCNGAGVIAANVVGWGNIAGTCLVKPKHAKKEALMKYQSGFWFKCGNVASTGLTYSMICDKNDATFTTTYADECGPAVGNLDGSVSTFLWNRNGNLNGWATTITQNAGSIFGYSAVTSTLVKLYSVPTSAYATKREWNNHAVQAFMDGAVYKITVTGCSTLTTVADRTTCVQRTLNWWRCYYGFPFNGASVCYANANAIPCPAAELGYDCPSSSKKGLLGLLGLLGIIPIFLIVCCLLLLCCLRRRKTEADVHFATFDPHAAPVMGTAHCAPMTACAGSFAPATMPVM